MLSLRLQKSQATLHGRLQFVRSRLLGAPLPRASRLVRDPEKQRRFVGRASSLVEKYGQSKQSQNEFSTPVPSVTVVEPVKTFAFPEIRREEKLLEASFIPAPAPKVVVREGKPVRQTLFAAFMGMSLVLLLLLFGPLVYFRFFAHEVVPVQTQDVGTPLGGEFTPPVQAERQIQKPPQEESLPEGNWVIIPRIGVRTEILESEVPEESLVKGVWRVPEFGQPGDNDEPMILAAHRYGYNWWWKGEYWKYHSFNLLPELEPGDLVEVISDKRKYLYEIYAGEEGAEITDYNADLILYTCKFLQSDIRHVRYARLIDPSKYSEYQTTETVVTPETQPEVQ